MDQSDESPKRLGIPRLHALIIGINKYQAHNRQDLQGCVADAIAIRNYFMGIGVPPTNLACLFDEQATREEIIKAFQTHLIDNPRIQPQEPIVVYFAGLGDCMLAPGSWNTSAGDGMVEMIIPHDAGYVEWVDTIPDAQNPSACDIEAPTERQSSALDTHRKYIHGIPDITLASLLHQLRGVKGNNITVILDCSHSGCGTGGQARLRSSYDSEAPPIPDTLDAQLIKSISSISPSKLKPGTKKPWRNLVALNLGSHILLAACLDNEQAQEIPALDLESEEVSFGGVFTTALLKELRSCDLETTSYTNLFRNLLAASRDSSASQDIGPQTFQCEGRNQDRSLFSVACPTYTKKIDLIPTDDKSIYRIRVGNAHGIVPGTRFEIFWDEMDSTAAPVILVARVVGTMTAQLHISESNTPLQLPENAYATFHEYNDPVRTIQIWVDERVKQTKLWQEIIENLHQHTISWATSPEHYDLALLPANGDLELRGALIPGQPSTSHILKHSFGAWDISERLKLVISFHLDLKGHNHDAPVCAHLTMALHELDDTNNSGDVTIREAIGGDLFGDSISSGTVVPLQCYPDKTYGLKLTNNSAEDLYPYVLYYDSEDCSIEILYPPNPFRGPLLRAGQSLTIGYGPEGSSPLQIGFTNPESDEEYGAFVLMVFSERAPVYCLKQYSPLEDSRSSHRCDRHIKKPGVWDIIVARVKIVKAD